MCSAGGGATPAALFVLISVVYPRRVQPAVFGLMSSAWVLPSLIGPPVAGAVSDLLSWHWVFLGLIPFVVAVQDDQQPGPSTHRAQERPHECRLADAGLPRHQHDRTRPLLGRHQRRLQDAELGPTLEDRHSPLPAQPLRPAEG